MSSSGFADGLGRRTLVFDRTAGVAIERLTVRPELAAFERALAERAARLDALDDDRIARVRSVERDPVSGAVTVDSDAVSGSRLADLIDAVADGSDEAPSAGLDVAVGFMFDVLPPLGRLHSECGMAHGAVGAGRMILTPAGRIVLLDALFGDALQRLQFTPGRLWTEFGLAIPMAAGPPRLDSIADLSQIGLTALMLALGRPLRRDEFPAGLPAALSEVIEIAQIRGSAAFATRFERFLRRMLPLGDRTRFSSAQDALAELRDAAGAELGLDSCRAALRTFVSESGITAAAHRPIGDSAWTEAATGTPPAGVATAGPAAPMDRDPAAVAATSVTPPAMRPVATRSFEVPLSLPTILRTGPAAETARAPLSDPAASPMAPSRMREPAIDAAPVTASVPAARPVPDVQPAPATRAPVGARAPVVAVPDLPVVAEPEAKVVVQDDVPLAAITPPVLEVGAPVPDSDEPADEVEPFVAEAPAAPAVITAVSPVAAEVETPVVVATTPSGRRKRNRGPRAKRDKLRSNALPPAPLAAPAPQVVPPAPTPAIEVRVEAPRPLPPPTPIRMPFAGPATPTPPAAAYAAQAVWHAPAAVAPGNVHTPAVQPSFAPATPASPAPVRIKVQAPAGYAPHSVKRTAIRPPERSEPAAARPLFQQTPVATGPSFGWKTAAAAIVIVAVGLFGSQGLVPERDASTAVAAAKPAAATPPSTPASVDVRATGTLVLESTPSGAKVLLDGAEAGQTPLTLSDVQPGRRVVTLVSAEGTVRRTVRVQAGKTVSLDIPVYSGFVNIIAPIVLEVAVGGRSIGTTEQGRLLLPPGRHELTLSNADLDYVATHRVEIQSGEEFRTKIEPSTTVSINALPWAEVWIDGKRVGETPLARLAMLLGTHEIVFRHPQFGERRLTTTIKAKSPSTLTVDFTKPERD